MKNNYARSILILIVLFALTMSPIGIRGATAAGFLFAKPAATGTGDCLSWDNACTLQDALAAAISGDEIWVMMGTHKPTTDTNRSAAFLLKSGVAVYGGFDGVEITRDERDWAANVTILSGEIGAAGLADNSYHVVVAQNVNGAVLDGFTISDGNASGAVPQDTGGGMYNNNSSPTLNNLIFNANYAGTGGGLANTNNSNPLMTNLTFTVNRASYACGGLYNEDSSPNMSSITLSDNTSTLYCGNMGNLRSNPIISNTTITGGYAQFGGGIMNDMSSPIFSNVTISGNSVSNQGGAMYNYENVPVFRNAIIWGNPTINGPQIFNNTTALMLIDSVVQGGCPVTMTTCTNVISADPLLGEFGSYGGPTGTFPLLPGSSAINTGNAVYCTTGSDQRGVSYVDACDIGAFESRGFTLSKTGGDNQETLAGTAFSSPLALSITSAHGEPVNSGRVKLTAPLSGAGLSTASYDLTIAAGAVSQSVSANADYGIYSAAASAAGANSANFTLTNTAAATYASPTGDCQGSIPCYTQPNDAITVTAVGGTVTLYPGTHAEFTIDKNVAVTMLDSVTVAGHSIIEAGSLTAPTLLTIEGNFLCSGGAFYHNNGMVSFNSGNDQSVTACGPFNAVEVNNPGTILTANSHLTIDSSLTIDTGAALEMGGHELILSPTATALYTSTPKNLLAGSGPTPFLGSTGIIINPLTTGDPMGLTTVTIHDLPEGSSCIPGKTTLARCFTINPTVTSGHNATLRFYFQPQDLNGISCNLLKVWHSSDGVNWTKPNLPVAYDCTTNPTGPYWLEVTGISDFSNFTLGPGSPTPVLLTDLQAADTGDGISLSWTAFNNAGSLLGFNVYRSEGSSEFTKVNNEPIAIRQPELGDIYTWVDTSAKKGVLYEYKVEGITTFANVWLGPVEVSYGLNQPPFILWLPFSQR